MVNWNGRSGPVNGQAARGRCPQHPPGAGPRGSQRALQVALALSLVVVAVAVAGAGGLLGGLWNGPTARAAAGGDGTPAEPLQVVATIFPIADLVRQVGGPDVRVTPVVPAGQGPETFAPTPPQMRQISRADLFVYAGGHLDEWALDLASAGPRRMQRVELVSALPGWQDGADPHVWLDPILVRDYLVPRIAEALAALRPERAAAFHERAERYQAELTELHQWIEAKTALLQGQGIIGYHAAWSRFAERYGLRQVASIEEASGTEPSPARVAEIARLARSQGVQLVVAEPQLSSRLAGVVAREIGGTVVTLDPLGGEGVPGRDSYIALMRYNAERLAEALR